MLSDRIIDRYGHKKWQAFKYSLIAIPFMIFIFVFKYAPLLGWAYAFCDYKPGAIWYNAKYVGLKQFQTLFADRELWRVLKNTLIFSIGGELLSPVTIFLAILLNDVRSVKTKKFIQTVTTFPNFISWVIVGGLATAIFSSSGLWNNVLKLLGMKPFTFGLIGSPDHTYMFMLLLDVWKGAGWGCILYLAAIAGIDVELYDAASVDGANKLQLIWHITVPELMPTFLVLRLMSVSNILNNGFDKFYIFWNTLVANKIEVLDYRIYQLGMENMRYSYSTATGVVKTLVGVFLLFSVNWLAKRIRGNSLI